jgi:hypothetical protein
VIGVEEGRSVQRAGRVGGSSVRCRPGGMGENGVARAETEQEQEQRERERERGEEEEEEEEEEKEGRSRRRKRRHRQRRWQRQRQRNSSRGPFVDDGKAAVSWRWRAGPQAGS